MSESWTFVQPAVGFMLDDMHFCVPHSCAPHVPSAPHDVAEHHGSPGRRLLGAAKPDNGPMAHGVQKTIGSPTKHGLAAHNPRPIWDSRKVKEPQRYLREADP